MVVGGFGRYELVEEIGQGGMGTVYRAYDSKMQRYVAVKVLRPELVSVPGYVERFRREAFAAARLDEPHVVPVYEADEVDGRLFLVMPLIAGTDLLGLLTRNGAMEPARAVKVVEQIGAALDAAHAAGLVHRDVKPSNVLLTDRDFVYLIDFGIAHDATGTKLTSTGTTMGTWGYMAPERFTTGAADASGDIYALACVLYQCLTGGQPFPGDSMPQQVHGHCYLDPPRPSAAHPGVPAGLDEVVARGMAKDPAQRYQSCAALVADAQRAISPGVAPPAVPLMQETMPASLYNEEFHRAQTQAALTENRTSPPTPHPGSGTGDAPSAGRRRTGISRNIIIGAAAALLVGIGGTVVLINSTAGGNKSGSCQTVSAPLSDVPTRTDQEPKLRVPVPAGWERITEMDNQDIRFAIRSPALTAEGFTPNAVVTLQKVPSDVGTPEQILAAQNEHLAKVLEVDDMNTKETEVCGVPAESTSYTVPAAKISAKTPIIPARSATSLGAVYSAGDTNYVAMLTVQSVKPGDKTFAADAEMILNGFQLLPPS